MTPTLRFCLASMAYILIVFPLAVLWHIGLFQPLYEKFGYFSGEPNIPLGLLTIIIQGIVLTAMFRFFLPGASGPKRAFLFVGLTGLFFWTSHVLALVAKQPMPDAMTFVAMETGYLVLQFGLFGLALGWLYRKTP